MKGDSLVEIPNRILETKQREATEKVLSEELGDRYIEYRKKWIDVSKRELVTDFPLYIQIEHSGRCNLRCPVCIHGVKPLHEDYIRGLGLLDIDIYKKVLAEAEEHNCPSIAFHNNDEPLLLKDIAERVRMAKEADFLDLILTTNATLLTPELAGQLIHAGLTKINFSVGAFSKEVYNKVRPPGDFEAVVRNIESFMEKRNSDGLKLPITRVTCVLTKYTIEEMEKFYGFWENKVDVVEFQNFQALKGYTEEFKPHGAEIDRTFTCNAPWQQIVLRPNGDVLPCCSFYGTKLVIGNVKDESIHDIWNGVKMKKIRKELHDDNFAFSEACQKCSGTFYIV